jgi:hypothetical protein
VIGGKPVGPGLEGRTFGPLTIVRSVENTGSAARYLDQATAVLDGIDLETALEAKRRYERRSSRSTASR